MMMVTMTMLVMRMMTLIKKNLLNCHQRLPDVFRPPMEGNLVQGFLYQADKCEIFTGQYQVTHFPHLFDNGSRFSP